MREAHFVLKLQTDVTTGLRRSQLVSLWFALQTEQALRCLKLEFEANINKERLEKTGADPRTDIFDRLLRFAPRIELISSSNARVRC